MHRYVVKIKVALAKAHSMFDTEDVAMEAARKCEGLMKECETLVQEIVTQKKLVLKWEERHRVLYDTCSAETHRADKAESVKNAMLAVVDAARTELIGRDPYLSDDLRDLRRSVKEYDEARRNR